MILVLPWAQHLHIFNSRQIKNLSITSVKIRHIVADKGKGWISQNGWHKKAKHVKFSGKWTFLASSYAHVRAHFKGLEMFVFRRIWRALFSCNRRFEIRPFALPPTICAMLNRTVWEKTITKGNKYHIYHTINCSNLKIFIDYKSCNNKHLHVNFSVNF